MHIGDVVFISVKIPVPQSGLLSKFVSRFVLPVMCKSVAFRLMPEFVGEGMGAVGIEGEEQQGKQNRQLHHDTGVCNTLPQSEAADLQTMDQAPKP